jgi:hypothetical protein
LETASIARSHKVGLKLAGYPSPGAKLESPATASCNALFDKNVATWISTSWLKILDNCSPPQSRIVRFGQALGPTVREVASRPHRRMEVNPKRRSWLSRSRTALNHRSAQLNVPAHYRNVSLKMETDHGVKIGKAPRVRSMLRDQYFSYIRVFGRFGRWGRLCCKPNRRRKLRRRPRSPRFEMLSKTQFGPPRRDPGGG